MRTTRTTIGKTKVPLRAWRARVRFGVVLAMLATALVGGSAPTAAADSPATAVLDWNKHAVEALANAPTAGTPGAGMAPPVQAVHLAIVHGAVYDAVNAIDGGHQPYLEGLPPAPASASQAAAAATAAYDVLVAVLIQTPLTATFTAAIRDAIVARLDALLAGSIAAATAADGAAAVSDGADAGEAAAAAMIAERAGDGRWGAFRFACGEDPGDWPPVTSTGCTTPSGPSDPFAWVVDVDPFVVQSGAQFVSRGPRELTSGAYAKEYNEVKALGAVDSARSAEQQAVFDFFVVNPIEMYNRGFRDYAIANGLTLAEQARLYAQLTLSGADALITCWQSKARYSFWRPITAIRLGDGDGNPNTDGDPNWTSAIANPPYPDHTSGYNCATGSYMQAAELYFGTERTSFTLQHAADPSSRTYQHFRDVWDDTIDARVYQGIHFRSADEQGAQIGRDVARWVNKHALQPVN